MFDFSAPLFWYKLIFMAELLISEALATYTLKKKSRFALRAPLSVLGCLAAAFFISAAFFFLQRRLYVGDVYHIVCFYADCFEILL